MKTNDTNPSNEIRSGVYFYNHQKRFLNATDYPYFRDKPENWSGRLDKIKSLGHEIVTCYIPWRHHEIETDGIRRFDFNGETSPNRNVIGFLQLCREKHLKVIIKPGPFIHAELNYGGLPDWVCPSFNAAIEPMLGASGQPFSWGGIHIKADGSGLEELPLPAPFDQYFCLEVERWLRIVTEEVIIPFAHPDGPVIMVQIANEGIYSNYQRAPWRYDYSTSSLRLYEQFLEETYLSLEIYNRRHGTSHQNWQEIHPPQIWNCPLNLSGILFFADWSAYQAYYMRELLTRLRSWIRVDLPFVINANPPTNDPFGVDAWLSRVNPDDLPGLNYGFTNWIGVACKDESVVERYQLMIKRARGANHEENWGFSKLYEPEFANASVCFYQTLIQIASGATGYNVYTGVETRYSSPDLDLIHQDSYPDSSPIDGNGQSTPKAESVIRLNRFFNRWGNEFLETDPIRPITFGLYLPYAHSAVWVAENDWEKAAALGIPDHGAVLRKFQQLCMKNHLDFDFTNLQVVDAANLQKSPTLVLAGGRWMDKTTQEKLDSYVQAGGRLVLIGEIPSLDENYQPTQILSALRNEIQVFRLADFHQFTHQNWQKIIAPLQSIIAQNREAESAWIWQYSHPDQELDYLFVFSGMETGGPIAFQFRLHGKAYRFSISLPPQSAALIRVQNGEMTEILTETTEKAPGEGALPACFLLKE